MHSYVVDELPALIERDFPVATDRARHLRPLDGRPRRAGAGAAPPRPLSQRLGARAHRRAERRCRGAKRRSRATSGPIAQAGQTGTPARSCARRTFAGTILVDQGTRDKFLDEQLRPERLRAACAAAGQPLELHLRDGYDHSYWFIASFVEEHLRHHARALGLAEERA